MKAAPTRAPASEYDFVGVLVSDDVVEIVDFSNAPDYWEAIANDPE